MNSRKTKAQLMEELEALSARVAELEHSQTRHGQAEREQQTLLRLSQQLIAPLNLEEIGQIMAKECRQRFEHDAFWLSVYNIQENTLSGLYIEDTPPGENHPVPIPFEENHYLTKEYPIFVSGQQELIDRREEPADTDSICFGVESRLSRSLMFAPIEWRGQVIGGLSVQSYTPGKYKESDLQVLAAFAGQCGGALARVRVKAALRESEERFRFLSEVAFEGIAIHDQGVLLRANEQYFRMFGYEPRELLGKQVLPLTVAPGCIEFVQEQIRSGSAGSYETIGLKKDGTKFPMEIRVRKMEFQGRMVRVGVFRDITERKEAEERFQFALSGARCLLWHADAALVDEQLQWDVQPVGVGLEAAQRFLPLDVRSGEDYFSAWQASRLPEDIPRTEYNTKTALLSGAQRYQQEYRCIDKDGRLRWISEDVFAQPSGVNRWRLVGVCTDITERKEAEEQLRESEERYRAIVEDQTELVCRCLPDTTITFVNEAHARYFGATPEEMVGRSILSMIPEENHNEIKAHFDSLGPQSPVATYEHHVVTEEGDLRWLQWTSRAILDENGTVIEFQSVGRDVTERKRSEEALRRSEERYRSLVEDASQPIFSVQKDGLFSFMNAAAAQILDGHPLDYVGKTLWESFPEDVAERQMAEIAKALRSGRPHVAELELEIQGEKRWFETNVQPMRNHQGEFDSALIVATDTTERTQAQQEVQALARLGTRLAGSSSVEKMVEVVREESERLLDWDAHYFALRHPEEDTFYVVSFVDVLEGKKKVFPPTEWPEPSISSTVRPILEGRSVLVNRNADEQGPVLARFGNESRLSASLMFVPVRSGDQVIGNLSAQSYTPGRYDESDLEVFQRFADAVAPALVRAYAEEAHRESEKRFRAQYKSIPIPTYTWQKTGEDFVLVDYNDTALAFTHGQIVNFVGTRLSEMYPDDPEIQGEMLRCFEKEIPIRREMPYRLKTTGEDKCLSVTYVFVPPDTVTVHTEDITERKAAEKALRESEKKYRALFEESRDAIYVTSREGRLLDANQAMFDLLGYSREELMSIHIKQSYADPGDRIKFQREIESKESVRDYEVKLRRKDGKVVHCLLTSTLRRSSDGSILGYQGIIRDVTEHKMAEHERQRLEQTRQEFIANASHEFKTPLTAIRGYAETLLEGAMENKQVCRRFLEIVQEHALRLERLTDDLLKISLIDEGRLLHEMTRVVLSDAIESCIETTRLKAEQKNITLRVDCPKDLPPVRGDAARLREVLQNLLDNAIHYTPAGGRISVRAAVAGDRQILISVSDTGIGIPKSKQQQIFDRFYRVDSGRSRTVGGTGLGLSIVRNLVQAHGGHIHVDSEPGRGSTFTVFLPQAEPHPESARRISHRPSSGTKSQGEL